MSAEKNITDAARALERVCSGRKGEGQPVIGARELHLSQVMDEKVEFRGYAAQAGLYQPVCAGWETKDVTTDPTSLCLDNYLKRYSQSPEIWG